MLYGAHVYDGYFSIMDVTNKANPVLINTQSTPGTFTHNCWLNDAGTVLFTTDEINNSFLASYDISNPQNIVLLDKYQTDPGSNVIVHNTHTLNDYEVVSWYKSGVVIVDGAHPDNMIETGHYDTSPLSGGGFDGCWGVYPYLPSGNLLVTDISEGLFVLTPTYVRGCYLEGAVSDSVTNVTLGNVRVEILGPSKVKFTNIQGLYKTGLADAGTYDVLFSKAGYYDKTITGVVLQNGVTTTLDVELIPQIAISFSGNVYDGTTNLPIPNADVIITGSNGNFSVTTDAAGNFTIPTFFGGTYDITAGKWGYVTNCQSLNITGGTVSIALHPGIYDDFTFNFNWSMSGSASSGLWERGEPLGTTNGNSAANPDFDVNNDCTDKAYVTGNTGVSGGDDDVDNGYTVIQSPVFDLTGYVNPIMNYSRWFYNAQGPQGGAPNDTLYIRIGNGSTIVNVQAVTATSPGNSAWVDESFPLNALITKTSAMRVYVYISDQAGSGNVCEGGFDHFEIIEGPTAVNELAPTGTVAVYPNPYTNQSNLHYNFTNANSGRLEVKNMLGETLKVYDLKANSGDIQLGNDMAKGVYIINLYSGEKQISTLKVVKL